jgi:hypothetical protein
MADLKGNEISKLLIEGKNSREIIELGYRPGTVYRSQRRWRRGNGRKQTGKSIQITSQDILSTEIRNQLREIIEISEIEMFLKSAKWIGEE